MSRPQEAPPAWRQGGPRLLAPGVLLSAVLVLAGVLPDEAPWGFVSRACAAPRGYGPGHYSVVVLDGPALLPAPGWPLWLRDPTQGLRPFGPSGLCFIGAEGDSAFHFLLADDSGGLFHCCVIDPDGESGRGPRIALRRVLERDSFKHTFSGYRVVDFEALACDLPRPRPWPPPDSFDVFVSIEGRGEGFRDSTRVVRLRVVALGGWGESVCTGQQGIEVEALGDAFSSPSPWHGFVQVDDGIAGVAVSPRRALLGLARGQPRGEFNVMGTALFIYDRARHLAARVRTRSLGILSIGGLSFVTERLIAGVDTDQQCLFVLTWDLELDRIERTCRFPIETMLPGAFECAGMSVEGVAVDDRGDFWCVVDPAGTRYRLLDRSAAPESVAVFVAAEMPVMLRYDGGSVWETVGLVPDTWRHKESSR